MAQTRKDLRGRVLRKGESQRRSDGRYVYTYTDPLGRRKYVYAQDLVTLREKETPTSKSVRFKWGEYVTWFRLRPEPVRYLRSGRFYPPDHRKYG